MKYALTLAFLAAISAVGQTENVERVGPTSHGGFLLNSGWRIQPAGHQIPLDTLPMSSLLTRDGKYLLVLNGGYHPPSISVIDVAQEREISRTPVPDAWLGMTFSADEHLLWVGGGSRASIYEYTFSNGELKPGRVFALTDEKPSSRDFIGDLALSPDGRLLYAADLYHDRILTVSVDSGKVAAKIETGRRPYRILFAPDGRSFFVTSWADGVLYQHQTGSGARMATLPLGAHPTDMVWSTRKPDVSPGDPTPSWDARLFVAAANTNNVYVVALSGTNVQSIETIHIAPTPPYPLGMTPSGLALDPSQTYLYAVCSDANAVAVISIEDTKSLPLGYVPTGWYPTAAKALKNGGLAVLNGRGSGSRPNPNGPNPARRGAPQPGMPRTEFVAAMQTGSLSLIPAFDHTKLEEYTQQVAAGSPYRDSQLEILPIPTGNPIPPNADTPSPIEHVIYVVKDDRSYDQVLGDLGKGERDASLTLFGESITPNHHKLAREFVLFDNFYTSGDVSADGLSWSNAAIASDYVQKMWPNNAAGRGDHYGFEGGEPAAIPPTGYLWTNALARGLAVRNYGHFVVNRQEAGGAQVASVKDSTLAPITNVNYRGFDLDYADTERIKVFAADLKSFEETNSMPKLILMRLANDHTAGTTPGRLTPQALMADNDYALGQLVDTVSHSKFWNTTAIFVVEDDAQNGPDHIDSHRAPAFVISPYTRRGSIDSTFYNTASVLRTIELIVGLRPLTHFDAAATPMWRAFAGAPVPTPYDAEKPQTSLTERNPAANGR